MRTLALPLAGALLAVVAVLGASTAPAADAPSPLRVRVTTLDGEGDEALVGWDARGPRVAGRGAPLDLGLVRAVRFAPDAPIPAIPDGQVGARIVLRGGEVVRGVVLAGDADGLRVRPFGQAEVSLSFDAIRRVEPQSGAASPCEDPTRRHPPREGMDLAWTRAGDAIAGTLAQASAEGVTIEQEGSRRLVPWADLVVLHVDEPALSAAEGLEAEVETAGGSRWVGSIEGLGPDGLAVRTRSGLSLAVPLETLVVARFRGGRFDYATDLAWTARYEPWYRDDDPSWAEQWFAPRADRRLEGCPPRIAGVAYRRGFCVYAKTTVEVPLDGRYASFRAGFGVDDEGAPTTESPGGNVTARVLADGREVWSSKGPVRAGEPTRSVGPLDVTGVRRLLLEVDRGEGLHVRDRADWVDPVLVRR